MSNKNKVNMNCQVCFSSDAEFTCSRCSNTVYCSEECQKRDWENQHANVCIGEGFFDDFKAMDRGVFCAWFTSARMYPGDFAKLLNIASDERKRQIIKWLFTFCDHTIKSLYYKTPQRFAEELFDEALYLKDTVMALEVLNYTDSDFAKYSAFNKALSMKNTELVELLFNDALTDPLHDNIKSIYTAALSNNHKMLVKMLNDKRFDPTSFELIEMITTVIKRGYTNVLALLMNDKRVYDALTEDDLLLFLAEAKKTIMINILNRYRRKKRETRNK